MKSWNPFGIVDMETGSFLKKSSFNKDYSKITENNLNNTERKKDSTKQAGK